MASFIGDKVDRAEQKIISKFPPPAFSDISKASNDVSLTPMRSRSVTQLLTAVC